MERTIDAVEAIYVDELADIVTERLAQMVVLGNGWEVHAALSAASQ